MGSRLKFIHFATAGALEGLNVKIMNATPLVHSSAPSAAPRETLLGPTPADQNLSCRKKHRKRKRPTRGARGGWSGCCGWLRPLGIGIGIEPGSSPWVLDTYADTEGAWESGVCVAPLGLVLQCVWVPQLTPWAIVVQRSGPAEGLASQSACDQYLGRGERTDSGRSAHR